MKRKGVSFTIFAMLLMLGMVVTIAGCSKGSELIGKWETPSGSDRLEFFSDGTADIDGDNGKWTNEKGEIKISCSFGSFTGKISGSTLTLFDEEDGDEEGVWQKVKEFSK